MTDEQYERLKKAKKLKKYGHLETWKELYYYQRMCADTRQMKEIASWAKRKNNGESVLLPLMKNKNDAFETAKKIFKTGE